MKLKTIWRIHSVLGLLAGLPLCIIALTGSALVFKDEINTLLMPEQVQVDAAARAPLPLDTRYEILCRELMPEYSIQGWALYKNPTQADFIYVVKPGTEDWLHLHQNQYTGELLGTPRSTDSDLMGWLLELHYTLLMDHLGIGICGVVAIILCLLGISGIWMYRKFWKHFFTFKWRSSLRMLAGNLHKRFGILASPILLILGLTGAIWNLSHLIEEMGHEHPEVSETESIPPATRTHLSLDQLLQDTPEHIPNFILTYIRFPMEGEDFISYYGSLAEQSQLRSDYNSIVSFNRQDGNYLSHSNMTEAGTLTQVYDAFTPLHYGTFGGLFTRILWCLFGSAPAFLALSGSYIWWKRSKK